MEVYKKLLSVQAKLKAPKGQYNTFGKYHYRNCEDILEAVKPLLEEVGCTLFVSDEIEIFGGATYITAHTHFVDCETGDTVEVKASAREELTKKGMDAAQITGSTSSYARKYALNGLFCIDDTKDADTDEQKAEGGARSAQTADKSTAQGKSTTKNKDSARKPEEEKISDVDVSVFREYLIEHKLSEEKILSAYKKKDVKELTVKNLTGIMKPENLKYWKQKCSL